MLFIPDIIRLNCNLIMTCCAIKNLDSFHHQFISIGQLEVIFGLQLIETTLVSFDGELELADERGHRLHAQLYLHLDRSVSG